MHRSRLAVGIVLAGVAVLAAYVAGGCPGLGSSSGGSTGATVTAIPSGGDTSDTATTDTTSTDTTSGDTSGGATATAATGAIDLAATGQTVSYVSGDDGSLQNGESLDAATRFVDNGDGTMTDQLTGLMWLQDASCLIHNYEDWETDGYANGWIPWEDAFRFIEQVNEGRLPACAVGYSDWRLPNVIELESLINTGQGEPYSWLMSLGFEGIEANDYWTSTTDPDTITTFAYAVVFSDGSVSRMAQKVVAITSVWPVRGTTGGSTTELWKTGQTTSYRDNDDGELQMGTAWPDPRFTDNGDGTVTDNLTGLMWLQDAAALGLADWVEQFIVLDRFNSDASRFEAENYTATYNDWRIPNRKEFFSLAHFAYCEPALPPDHPFIGVSVNGVYWTSSTNAGATNRAWWADMRTGELGHDLKVNGHLMWFVR